MFLRHPLPLTRILALALSLAAVLISYLVADRIFEQMPHIEDEWAYNWQAQVLAAGRFSTVSPPYPESLLVPFVVDHNGQRFGKYPPGWPLVLAIGVRFGLRSWVNPVLAGLGIWLIYILGRRLFDERTGLLAAALALTSPFFQLNSASLLSHPLGLVLSAAFTLSWLDVSATPGRSVARRWLAAGIAGVCLGWLALTRPLTAVGLAIPFAGHGLWLLWRADWPTRRRLLLVAGLAAGMGSLLFWWQYTVTGSPFTNPYTLWWPYDKIGFGPGVGVKPGGHTLSQGWFNTQVNLAAAGFDLFGWGPISWILLPFGVLAARRSRPAWLAGASFVSLVIVYMAYWIGAQLFGPRYYYEALPALAIFSAAGAFWLAGAAQDPQAGAPSPAGRAGERFLCYRRLAVAALLTFLVAINLVFYLPIRLEGMRNLYTINRAALQPFQTPAAQALTPALVIVHSDRWMSYGNLLELEDTFLGSPFIFAWSLTDDMDRAIAALYPNRTILHYYTDEPGRFYHAPRPTPTDGPSKD